MWHSMTRVILLILLYVSLVTSVELFDRQAKHTLGAANRAPPFDVDGDPGVKIEWRSIIESVIEVRCSDRHMTALLHYSSSYSRLTNHFEQILKTGSFFAGPKPTARCTAIVGPENGALVIQFDLDQCGVTATHRSNSTVYYETTMTFEVGQPVPDHFHILEHFPVTCIHPVHLDESTATTSLSLYDTKIKQQEWKFPQSVDVGKLVFLQAHANIPWYSDNDLYGFPVKCWTSPSAYRDMVPKKLFVNEGCPVSDQEHRGLSRMHHFKNKPLRVSFNLGWYLLFRDQSESDDTAVIYVHCELIPCVQSYTKGILNIPKCPISHYCAGVPDQSHNLPSYLVSTPRQTVSVGPIIARQKPDADKDAVRCKITCDRWLAEQAEQARLLQQNIGPGGVSRHIYVQGVSTVVTVTIAVASFLLGIMLMGALWFVHVHTDPHRKLAGYNSAASGRSRTPQPNGLATPTPVEGQQQMMLNPL